MTKAYQSHAIKHLSQKCLSQVLPLAALCLVGIGASDAVRVGALANERPTLDQLLEGVSRPVPSEVDAPAEVDAPTEIPPTEGEGSGLPAESVLPSNEGQPANEAEAAPEPFVDADAAETLQQAAAEASQARQLAQTAASAADWDDVMRQWLAAIALAQSIPPESPSRITAQRRLREYVQQLQEVQRRTEQASPSSGVPSFGSPVFDAQLAGYLSYVATEGAPDVLIVGSSRALQGVDPDVMQQTLASRGFSDLRVFNFSVNGATAKVVNFVLSELLPQPLPAVIVWGDGSRAFNDGRRDRTWEGLVASPGYRAIQSGAVPEVIFTSALATHGANHRANSVTLRSPLTEIPANLDALGFSAVGEQFSPQTYYQQVRRVEGRYDGAYSPFTLYGEQTDALAQLAALSAAQGSQLIFVNLPLSDSYLDDFRRYYEGQFQQYLQAQSATHGFAVVDWLTQWQGQPALFADPSHINQDGAAVIATQLAQHPTVLAAIRQSAASQQTLLQPISVQPVSVQTVVTQPPIW